MLGAPSWCPYCRGGPVRPSNRPLALWERLFLLRRYRCLSCWRRLVAFLPRVRVVARE
ncbi:MAG TPA: hypothetical protein VL691_04250 [Vicinamibacteria bacterium]|nr:hypothetical protein [Vicinamibacteria bacterium]